MTTPTIHTEHIRPPVPTRRYDWRATFDGYEPGDLMGYGPTEQAAIDDLLELAEMDACSPVFGQEGIAL